MANHIGADGSSKILFHLSFPSVPTGCGRHTAWPLKKRVPCFRVLLACMHIWLAETVIAAAGDRVQKVVQSRGTYDKYASTIRFGATAS
jgi:hypothetical protein